MFSNDRLIGGKLLESEVRFLGQGDRPIYILIISYSYYIATYTCTTVGMLSKIKLSLCDNSSKCGENIYIVYIYTEKETIMV